MYAVSQIGNQASVASAAAHCGHLRLLQHLHENGYAWSEGTCTAASRQGHLDCLQYAHESGCPWDVSVYSVAARNGHLHCMQYAHQQGLEWNAAVCMHAHVCMHAAMNGKLSCLQFAHENGCPWDSLTTAGAAQNGHLHCVRYALEHGCPANEGACRAACEGGHLECLQLLHQSGVPCNAYTAAKSGNLNCVQYLVENQALHLDEEVFKVALLRGDLANLRYLLDQGCPFLGAKFDDDYKHDYYTSAFSMHNPEFALCVAFAVGCGWVPCDGFMQFVMPRDEESMDWLIQEGFYADVVTASEKRKYD